MLPDKASRHSNKLELPLISCCPSLCRCHRSCCSRPPGSTAAASLKYNQMSGVSEAAPGHLLIGRHGVRAQAHAEPETPDVTASRRVCHLRTAAHLALCSSRGFCSSDSGMLLLVQNVGLHFVSWPLDADKRPINVSFEVLWHPCDETLTLCGFSVDGL